MYFQEYWQCRRRESFTKARVIAEAVGFVVFVVGGIIKLIYDSFPFDQTIWWIVAGVFIVALVIEICFIGPYRHAESLIAEHNEEVRKIKGERDALQKQLDDLRTKKNEGTDKSRVGFLQLDKLAYHRIKAFVMGENFTITQFFTNRGQFPVYKAQVFGLLVYWPEASPTSDARACRALRQLVEQQWENKGGSQVAVGGSISGPTSVPSMSQEQIDKVVSGESRLYRIDRARWTNDLGDQITPEWDECSCLEKPRSSEINSSDLLWRICDCPSAATRSLSQFDRQNLLAKIRDLILATEKRPSSERVEVIGALIQFSNEFKNEEDVVWICAELEQRQFPNPFKILESAAPGIFEGRKLEFLTDARTARIDIRTITSASSFVSKDWRHAEEFKKAYRTQHGWDDSEREN